MPLMQRWRMKAFGQILKGKCVKHCTFVRYTRVVFYFRKIGLYLYKYRIYGTISTYFLKGLAFAYQLI